MILLVLSFICCVVLNGASCYAPDPRIVGGTEVTNRTEFSYQALLLYKGVPICGGTIIDEKHVLTAAHCCFPVSDLRVKAPELSIVVGNLNLYDRSDEKVKEVTAVIVHEEYDPDTIINDIALLRISGSFENMANVSSINLTTDHLTNGTCRVSGWGSISTYVQTMNKKLLYVEVPLIDRNICNESYSQSIYVGENEICAGSTGKDSCFGDSGGPLVCFGKLTGIVSYGAGCAVENYPGVYTEVAKYTEWIELSKFKSSAVRNRLGLFIFYMMFINIFS